MEITDIQRRLGKFLEPLTSQTYLGTYRDTPRSSLLKDGLSTRANSIWKMAQYVIATYDNDKNTPLKNYLDGWSQLAKKYHNQYLIIAIDEKNWEIYDSQGVRLGDNNFIANLTVTKQIKNDKASEISLQKIYYGCPGTGKSHKVKGLTEGADGEKTVYFDESGAKVADVNVVEDKSKLSSNIFRTTFHPDYDYSSFVGSYKPVMQPVLDADGNETGKEDLVYAFVPQVFTNAYVRAWKSLADESLTDAEKQVYLIIEEINRGNCAQIFGDLFQLLDRKNGFSEYPIIPDAELRKYLAKEKIENNMLRLPANLHILATMNTSDQSLFPMDSAFKRRWAMEYIPINLEQEKAKTFTFNVKGVDYSWVEFLAKVNPLIRKATDSEDKQMGEFFIKESVSEEDFKNKVMFYIWNDVCKDLYSASRISPLFFMRSADGDDRKDVFTFAELFGSGRYNEEANDYTLPSDLLEGFIKNYLKLKPKTATTPNAE